MGITSPGLTGSSGISCPSGIFTNPGITGTTDIAPADTDGNWVAIVEAICAIAPPTALASVPNIQKKPHPPPPLVPP